MSEKEIPHCCDLEQRVIACIYSWDDEALPLALTYIGEESDCFYDPKHRTIYDAMVAMYRNGDIIRPESVIANLDIVGKLAAAGGEKYIMDSIQVATTSNYIETYSKTILECHRRRGLILACKAAQNRLYDMRAPIADTAQALESSVFKMACRASKETSSLMSNLVVSEAERIKRMVKGEATTGIRTGFRSLDRILLPMRPADYIILAATTSTGKTTLACNIALNVAREGTGVLFFSMEMSRQAITNKLLGIESDVDLVTAERSSWLPDGAEQKINSAAGLMQKYNMLIDEECGLTPTRLRTKARAHMAQNNFGLIVLDYLGRMHVKGMENDPTNSISVISSEIKDMAKELGVPVLVLCQLSRAGAEGKPKLNHLRQSGALEQDCDVAILLSRCKNEKYVCVEVAKQRTGPIGEATLFFKRDTQRFLDTNSYGDPIWPGTEHMYEEDKTQF